MDDAKPDTAASPLLGIDPPHLVTPLRDTAALRHVREAITSSRHASLWIEGAVGSGRTTAVARVLGSLAGCLAIRRVQCRPGLRLEEVLHGVGDFLLHAGVEDLHRVLRQRTALSGKLDVLLRLLDRYAIVLWFDDVEYLEAGSSAEEGGCGLAQLLDACATLPESARGRFIFTSESRPPLEGLATRCRFGVFTEKESRAYWSDLEDDSRGANALPELSSCPALEGLPLALQIVHRLRTLGGEEAVAACAEGAHDLASLYSRALEHFPASTRELLEVLAVFRRPASRAALRKLSRLAGDELFLDEPASDPRLEELRRTGLLTISSLGRDGAPLYCAHPLVWKCHENGAWRVNPSRERAVLLLAADHFLRSATGRRDVWALYNARTCFWRAGCHEEASELQRLFIEDLLRLGYLDLARRVLSETAESAAGALRAICLGNLAIIYKNEGRYDEALQLYERVRQELFVLGDKANLARVLHQIGNVHCLRGDFPAALDHYGQSATISSELNEPTVMAATQVQIANVLCQSGREAEALVEYEAVIERLNQDPREAHRSLIAAVNLQIGQIHQKAGKYVEAESCFAIAEEILRAADDQRGIIKVLRAQALVARERREYDRAAQCYEEAARTAAALGDLIETAICQILLGDLEKDRVQFGRSLIYYGLAQNILETPDAARSVTGERLEALSAWLDERLADLATTMGPEAFRRARQRARGGE